MIVTVPDWLAQNIAWVSVVGIAGGVGTYLLKKRGMKKAKTDAPAQDWRRADDRLLDRFLASQDKMATAIEHLADSRREEMKGLCEEMRNQTSALVEMMSRGFRDVHGRIDVMIAGPAKKGAHHLPAA